MTKKEYASELAKKLRNNPTKGNIQNVAAELISVKIGDRTAFASEIEEIIAYMDEELGDYSVLFESFDNQDQLSVMRQFKNIIKQANENKAVKDPERKDGKKWKS